MVTNFQENLYKFLSEYIKQFDRSPSYAEIIQAMEISPRSKSLITRNLRKLEKEGLVVLTKKGRGVSITIATKKILLLGRISAGSPIEAIPECQFIDVNNVFKGSDQFALTVNGNSMIEDGILSGDIIICKKSNYAKEGDIVVVLIDQHNATLKRISYKMKSMITLIPANTELKPRAYSPERIHIQGIYVGLIRKNGGG